MLASWKISLKSIEILKEMQGHNHPLIIPKYRLKGNLKRKNLKLNVRYFKGYNFKKKPIRYMKYYQMYFLQGFHLGVK